MRQKGHAGAAAASEVAAWWIAAAVLFSPPQRTRAIRQCNSVDVNHDECWDCAKSPGGCGEELVFEVEDVPPAAQRNRGEELMFEEEDAGLVFDSDVEPEIRQRSANIFGDFTREIKSLIASLHPIVGADSAIAPLIRLGPEGDGGYVVPDDLDGVTALFSPGVAFVSGFERDCADRGIAVFMADKSVERPAAEHGRFTFAQKFVGRKSDTGFMTLLDWVTGSVPDTDGEMMLQMDIEGFEYEVLQTANESLMRRFRILVIEFHDLELMWSRAPFQLYQAVFEKLLLTHSVIHIHPNNCCGDLTQNGVVVPAIMEFTLLRNDRVSDRRHRRDFPHPLDHDNTPDPTLELPAGWFGGLPEDH